MGALVVILTVLTIIGFLAMLVGFVLGPILIGRAVGLRLDRRKLPEGTTRGDPAKDPRARLTKPILITIGPFVVTSLLSALLIAIAS